VVSKLRQRARVGFGRRASVTGRLTSDGGRPIPSAEIQLFRRSQARPEELIRTLRTGPRGRFRYRLPAGSSRALRFVYTGTAVSLPAESQVTVLVQAATTIAVSRRRLVNGGAVQFRGRLRAPKATKLIELQVRLSGQWQTFRTTRTGAGGRWKVAYRFRRTCGLARYRFRARLPKEQGYPYETGATRTLKVSVRGPECR